MKKLVKRLAEACRDAIEKAACNSYSDGTNPFSFDGVACTLQLSCVKYDVIEVSCDDNGTHEVCVCHKDVEHTNIEDAIAAYLDGNADEFSSWQEAHENDRGSEPYIDPGFASWVDYCNYMYR